MLDNLDHLDLTFPDIPIGDKETPLDLRRLLYKGGSSLRVDQADQAIQEGMLGNVRSDRIELVRLIHEDINGRLVGGGSPKTARQKIANMTLFFSWSDTVEAALNLEDLVRTYLAWTEHLLQRVRVVKNIKQLTAYNKARIVGQILDGVLGRAMPIVGTTRLRRPRARTHLVAGEADKQNLHTTFPFGRLLQDICDGTPLTVIWGPPLVRIQTQSGKEIEYKARHGDSRPQEERIPANIRRSNRLVMQYKADRSMNHRFRSSLVNLRIQSELLIFIGQTSMNLTQAQNIPLRHFSYSSDIDGYKVREYKARRNGEVLFEIFSEYRGHFERYLAWRKELFPNSENRLFPLIRNQGSREDCRISFWPIQTACIKLGITWTPPTVLRKTRVNWLLRRTGDPDMTAEMSQHHKQTLLNIYETPSQQRAIREITRFHLRNDPDLIEKSLLLAVAPGECNGVPKISFEKPQSAPEPDCLLPSGCLWCEHHRDIDSLDHVWSLACFRHLKILELSRIVPITKECEFVHPAQYSIARLTEKLSWFRESNSTRREWVEESLTRLEEGFYHDQWAYLIRTLEGSSE